MYSPLYLDTARIGLMTPEARQSCNDAMALAMRDPGLIFREFQTDCNSNAIRHWSGIRRLRKDVLHRIAIPTHDRMLAASNSASLLALAARCLFALAPRLLTTDLVWPNHFTGLNNECLITSGEIVVVKVRDNIINGSSAESVISAIVSEYERRECQSLFLTAVSFDGIRLPIGKIIEAVSRNQPPRLVVVDGAQEFAQFDSITSTPKVDLYLFGSHKWLGAYHPLSLATYGRRDSAMVINQVLNRMIAAGEINDPTLKSSMDDQFEYQETINLLPFFSLAGAIETLNKNDNRQHDLDGNRRNNLEQFSKIVSDSIWKERFNQVQSEFLSAISVINRPGQKLPMNAIENRLETFGVSATVLADGGIRTSMPQRPFTTSEHTKLAYVLSSL